jgi:hypothetical protein
MFHKNNCRCCNDYVTYTVRAYKEQGINLPSQAVGDTITTAWLALMRDLESEARARALEDYNDLADDAVSLKAELKASQSVLANKCSRVETICDLKDEIVALKRSQSTASTRPITLSSRAAGPSSLSRLVYKGSMAYVSERRRPNTANPEGLV